MTLLLASALAAASAESCCPALHVSGLEPTASGLGDAMGVYHQTLAQRGGRHLAEGVIQAAKGVNLQRASLRRLRASPHGGRHPL